MAHFAQLDENNIVIQVFVVSNDDCPGEFPDSEQIGIEYLASLGLTGNFKQTSYNANFRRKYAGIGDEYVQELDGFRRPKPGKNYLFDSTQWLWVNNGN